MFNFFLLPHRLMLFYSISLAAFQNERRFASFYLEKVFIVGILSILSLAFAYQTTYEHTDFTYNLLFDWGAYEVRSIFLYLFR